MEVHFPQSTKIKLGRGFRDFRPCSFTFVLFCFCTFVLYVLFVLYDLVSSPYELPCKIYMMYLKELVLCTFFTLKQITYKKRLKNSQSNIADTPCSNGCCLEWQLQFPKIVQDGTALCLLICKIKCLLLIIRLNIRFFRVMLKYSE